MYTQVYLVTGGFYYSGSSSYYLKTTELLVAGQSQWTTARSLPSSRYGHRAVTLGNRLIISGEMMIGMRIIIMTSLPYFRVKLSCALCLLIEKNSLKLP